MGLFDFFLGKDLRALESSTNEKLSSLIRPLAYDEEEKYFLLDGKAVGIGFHCYPLSGLVNGL